MRTPVSRVAAKIFFEHNSVLAGIHNPNVFLVRLELLGGSRAYSETCPARHAQALTLLAPRRAAGQDTAGKTEEARIAMTIDLVEPTPTSHATTPTTYRRKVVACEFVE